MHTRLQNFIHALPPNSLTVLRGNRLVIRNGDVHYPFRQDSDILYLTGLSVPDIIITIYNTEIILWRESITDKDRIWGTDKLTDEELSRISGITDVRERKDFVKYRKTHPTITPENTWRHITHTMRMTKAPDEIMQIERAIRITEAVYEVVRASIQPGMYEYEVEAIIAYGFRRAHGVEAFPTIVASGQNSCTLHYTENTRQIQTGDIILIDFGIELDGYGADISRTFAIGGFSERQQSIYDAVERVKVFAEKTLKPDITRKVWNQGVKEYMYHICEELRLQDIEKYTPSTNPYFPHSIGHFLGLDTHDVGESDTPLQAGMILTIEPGIYIRDEAIGIRIEDDYLITATGCTKL